ncbi:HAD family phosphatase [Parabacteroides sp. OttesenSCG-928-N08]|nr:HAD family phosphatase [Parabacteroides sp. OttesenSCG-928-N08]
MKTALFDFDGVLVDTEPIYDIFWDEASERYGLGIDNFAYVIKGTTLPHIIETYFKSYPVELQEQVRNESAAYERAMELPEMPGSFDFLRMLKANGVRIGLVTSSDLHKVNRAMKMHQLEGIFDTIVTADRITSGKPDPMCYLLAAKDLGVDPSDCLVFEDSFAGIAAGTAAGMRVIGLSTTNPKETLEEKVYEVIPNFIGKGIDDYLQW